MTQYVGEEWSRLLTTTARSSPVNATSQGDLRTSCLAAYSVRRLGSAGRQSPLNPDAQGCRSSDRAGRCCVHRLARGRGGRREDE